MTPTAEQIALILDPERKLFWKHTESTWKEDEWSMYGKKYEHIKKLDPPVYTGPDFPADDAACFQELAPIFMQLGCRIEMDADWTSVNGPRRDTETKDLICITEEKTFALATCAALAWASENMPEELRSAREVSACI